MQYSYQNKCAFVYLLHNEYANSCLYFTKNIDIIYTMSYLNDLNIDILETGFHKITCLCVDLFEQKKYAEEELTKLKKIYTDLIKTNNQQIYLFCLDSFYFKYRVLHKELEGISELIIFIHNRMYGEYYKLYNIMVQQLKDKHIHLPTVSEYKKYPIYKDLELMKEYSIDDIKDIYYSIFSIINELYSFYNTKQSVIQEYINQNNKIIYSFIHTLEYENVLRRELLSLYIGYVEFFHSTQTKYLEKLLYRMHIFQQDISEDMISSKTPGFIENINKTNHVDLMQTNPMFSHNTNNLMHNNTTITINDKLPILDKSNENTIVVAEELQNESVSVIEENMVIEEKENITIYAIQSELPELPELFQS